MNIIIERISKENLKIEKHYGEKKQFAYHGGKNLITYPAFEDLDQHKNMFILAHELGHHYQYLRYGLFMRLLSDLSRMKHFSKLLFFPYLLWEEIDAWIRAWKICKEENVLREGFLEIALKSLLAYVFSFFSQLFHATKYILGIYISIVFVVRFLTVSHEMNLQQPEWILDIRNELVASAKSHNELITELFFGVLNMLLLMLIFFLFMRIFLMVLKLR